MPPDDKVLRPLPGPENLALWRQTRDRLLGSTDWQSLTATANGAIQSSLLTTRGDMIRRSATAPERFAKGAQNTLLTMGADDPDWATLSAVIIAAFGTTRGDLLIHGENGIAKLQPGTSGHFLKSNGALADPSWAANTPPVWTRITASDGLTITGTHTFTDLAGYQEIFLTMVAATADAASQRTLRVSVDNGANYLSTSGDYLELAAGGVTSRTAHFLSTASSGAAQTFFAHIKAFNVSGAPKVISPSPVTNGAGSLIAAAAASAALNAIQFSNLTGSPTGGTLHLLGLPSA